MIGYYGNSKYLHHWVDGVGRFDNLIMISLKEIIMVILVKVIKYWCWCWSLISCAWLILIKCRYNNVGN